MRHRHSQIAPTSGKGGLSRINAGATFETATGQVHAPIASSHGQSIKDRLPLNHLRPLIMPPQLLGMIPTDAGGFGDMEKSTRIFIANEVAPIRARMTGLNDMFGAEIFRFVLTSAR